MPTMMSTIQVQHPLSVVFDASHDQNGKTKKTSKRYKHTTENNHENKKGGVLSFKLTVFFLSRPNPPSQKKYAVPRGWGPLVPYPDAFSL